VTALVAFECWISTRETLTQVASSRCRYSWRRRQPSLHASESACSIRLRAQRLPYELRDRCGHAHARRHGDRAPRAHVDVRAAWARDRVGSARADARDFAPHDHEAHHYRVQKPRAHQTSPARQSARGRAVLLWRGCQTRSDSSAGFVQKQLQIRCRTFSSAILLPHRSGSVEFHPDLLLPRPSELPGLRPYTRPAG